MKELLVGLFKFAVCTALIVIAINDIEAYVDYRLDIQQYEIMAKKYDCTFLTASSSRSDVGMFDCNSHIVFKKLEQQ